MSTFEEFLIEIFIERASTPSPKEVQEVAANYAALRQHMQYLDAVHDAAVEASRRYSDQNVKAVLYKLLRKFDSFIEECKTFDDDDFMEGQRIGAGSMKAYCAQLLDEFAQ